MKTRYAITHIGVHGFRTLTFANQGRHHYDTREQAEHAMAAFAPSLREKVLGMAADTLRVVETECYDHGDAVRIFVDHLDGDLCPHGHAYRIVNGKHTIDCDKNVCSLLYRYR